MARTSMYPLVDRLLGGTLADWLSERREAGDSFATITRALEAEHDVVVTTETVRQWCYRSDTGDAA